MKKTLLITGGAGYIGSHISLLMAQQGYQIIVLDSLVYNQPFNQSWATLIKSDFADKEVLKNIFEQHAIDAVIHCAASIEVGRSVKEPLPFYENNVTKTLTLLNSMLEHQVKKFIFSSSCAVYGIPHALPLVESHSKKPISPYGTSKLMVEMILQELHAAHGLNFVALRYFNAAGLQPGHGLGEYHEPETHVIPLLLTAARKGTPFYIYGTDYPTPDGSCIRDFLHVIDIAQAHLKALEHLDKQGPSDFFNLGTGAGWSVKQLIQSAEKITGTKIKVTQLPRREGDPAVLVADAHHAMHILQWQPRYSELDYILQTAYAQEIGQPSSAHIIA